MQSNTSEISSEMFVYPSAQPPQPALVHTRVVSMEGSTYGAEKSVGLGVAEIILRVICMLSCLATLSVAAGAVSTVNDIKDYGELEHADKYRGAAGWLVFVGLAGVFYHGIIIFILILYFAANIGRSFAGFSCSNVVLCILFGLSLIAGARANLVYSSDNKDLYDNSICHSNSSYYYYDLDDVCDDLERLYISEGAAAGLAFLSMLLFIPLFIIALVNEIRKMRKSSYQGSHNIASAPYVHLPNEF